MIDLLCDGRFAAAAGPFLALAAGVSALARARRRPPAVRAALVALCAAAVLVPVAGLPVYGYAWGVIGQVSVTTMLLLGCLLAGQLVRRRPVTGADAAWILGPAALAGLVIYPTGLGMTPVDLYRLGYSPLLLLAGLAALVIAAWMRGRRAAALIVVIAVAAFDLHLLESDNLWDYLTDPLLTLAAWGWVVVRLAGRPRRAPRGARH